MVKVCDAIMGSGKTESAIRYMNERKNERFIYITPYLTESARIKEGCRDLNFIEPSDKLAVFDFKKSNHTKFLISEGKNISTTHQAFRGYTKETLMNIKEMGYNLIVDENVDVLEDFEFSSGDLQMAVEAGYIEERNNAYYLGKKPYEGIVLKKMFNLLESRELFKMNDRNKETLFFWSLPKDLFTSFKEVIIMTYMFEAQSIHHFLKINNIDYEYIGIERLKDGGFRFGKAPGYVPEYTKDIRNHIQIIDNERMNEIGADRTNLSMSWYEKHPEKIGELKNNVYNCINNIWRDVPADKKIWGTFNDNFKRIKGKGYTKSFLTFNCKATNQYRDKTCLVYIANVYMSVKEKRFYALHGLIADDDAYALSIMVQWIWRSAIRDGNDVQIYIPSKRMRNLLIGWMNSFERN